MDIGQTPFSPSWQRTAERPRSFLTQSKHGVHCFLRFLLLAFDSFRLRDQSAVLILTLVTLLLACGNRAFAQSEVVVNFEKAEITGRWVDLGRKKG